MNTCCLFYTHLTKATTQNPVCIFTFDYACFLLEHYSKFFSAMLQLCPNHAIVSMQLCFINKQTHDVNNLVCKSYVLSQIYVHTYMQHVISYTVRYKILQGENFGEFGELQAIRQNFLVQNFLLWLVRNMCELAWMALLKYFQLKSTCKQPLPYPNGELSPSSGISSANAHVAKLLN